MSPLHYQIKAALLPVLLETRQQCFAGIDEKTRQHIVEAARKLADNPKDDQAFFDLGGSLPGYVIKPLLCLFLVKDSTQFTYPIGRPYITIHSSNRTMLAPNANVAHLQYSVTDIRLATTMEIEQCLDDLNEYQLRHILRDDIFAPIITNLLSDKETVLEEPPEDKSL